MFLLIQLQFLIYRVMLDRFGFITSLQRKRCLALKLYFLHEIILRVEMFKVPFADDDQIWRCI